MTSQTPATPAARDAHRANYEQESKQKTLTAAELHAQLAAIVAAGHGPRPVFIMDTERGDGLTHAVPILACAAAEVYDGAIVWLFEPIGARP